MQHADGWKTYLQKHENKCLKVSCCSQMFSIGYITQIQIKKQFIFVTEIKKVDK